jgi:hypothetical protein
MSKVVDPTCTYMGNYFRFSENRLPTDLDSLRQILESDAADQKKYVRDIYNVRSVNNVNFEGSSECHPANYIRTGIRYK